MRALLGRAIQRVVGPLAGVVLLAGVAASLTGCYAEDDAYVSAGAEVGYAPQVQISTVSDFYPVMAPYGSWYESDLYGDIWCPTGVSVGWTPYSNGHWVYTSYGWTFVGAEPWGWAGYHYGRWVETDVCPWAWIPDVTWGPAWVDWRTWNGYVAWEPMGPMPGRVVHFNSGPTYNPPAGGLPKVVIHPTTVAAGGISGVPTAGIQGGNRWNIVANGDLANPNLGGHIVHPGQPLPPMVQTHYPTMGPAGPAGAGIARAPVYGRAPDGSPIVGPGSATRRPEGSSTTAAPGSWGYGGTYRGGYGSVGGYTPPPPVVHYSAPSVSYGGGWHGGSAPSFHSSPAPSFHSAPAPSFHSSGGGFHGGGGFHAGRR